MTGANDRTTAGLREFLATLPTDEILKVLKASSAGQVMVKSKDEAIAELIKWSDAISILNRQRVKKEYLFTYLIKKNVKVSMSATKTALCQLVLKSWEWAEGKEEKELKSLQFLDPPPKPKPGATSSAKPLTSALGKANVVTQIQPSKISSFFTKSDKELELKSKSKPDEIPKPERKSSGKVILLSIPTEPKLALLPLPAKDKSSNEPKPELPAVPAKDKSSDEPKPELPEPVPAKDKSSNEPKPELPVPVPVKSESSKVTTCEVSTNTDPCTTVSAMSPDELAEKDYEVYISLRQKEQQIAQELALQFSKWYYERFNSMVDFISEHFWMECNLRVEYISNIQKRKLTEFLNDGKRCYEEICYLRSKQEMYFNPNLLAGVRGKINPHGLAQIVVFGALHSPNETGNQIGNFEQVFGLLKDPSNNNFKIKSTMIKLLQDSEIVNADPLAICDYSLKDVIEDVDDDEDEWQDAIEEGLGLD